MDGKLPISKEEQEVKELRHLWRFQRLVRVEERQQSLQHPNSTCNAITTNRINPIAGQ
jgi:hypothetical protein